MTIIIILIVIAVVIVGAVVGLYNGLIRSRVKVDESWSDIAVQLKRRADLIPNLINTVKGYATHEKEIFEKVAEMRAQLVSATDKGAAESAKAENNLAGALKTVFAIAENYPDLKANQNFMQLQDDLKDTEDKISASRRFYNSNVTDLNTKIQTFPGNVFAGMFGITSREFFNVEDRAEIEKPVEVKF
jgi:LemA protein